MALTANDLAGIYSFVPIPWNEDYEVDEETLRHDARYLARTDLAGIYTPDSSGEFFNLPYDEFCSVVDIMADAVESTGTQLQIGCHWTNARGAIRRAAYAAERGVDAIRFSFPYWEQVTDDEALRFVELMADVADPVPLVHYNNPNSRREFGPDEYRRIVDSVPGVIGTKQLNTNPYELAGLLDRVPELSHYVTEAVFTEMMAAGASGSYSWIGAINPELAVEWYDSCRDGNWARAMEIQTMVNRFRVTTIREWGYSFSGTHHKLNAGLNPNLECGLRVSRPYTQGTEADVRWAREWTAENLPEILLDED